MKAMQKLGVPYDAYQIQKAQEDLKTCRWYRCQSAKEGVKVSSDCAIIALIAYLQRIGTDIKKTETAATI